MKSYSFLTANMSFKRSKNLHTSVGVKASNRPIKIAYLIPYQEADESHLIIDAVFHECYTRWAGARTLVIPTDADKFLHDEYEKWLAFYDPDFIYSYVKLDSQLIEKIDMLCSPIAFLGHKTGGNLNGTQWRDFLPDLPIKPVSSLSTIHGPSSGYSHVFWGEHERKIIVTQRDDDVEDRFLSDNFGKAFNVSSTLRPVAGLYDTLCLTAASLPENIVAGTNRVHSMTDILSHIADKRATTVSRFAMARSASIPLYESNSWSNAINLFIGETCLDRINFWNARHFSPDDAQGALIIGIAHFNDPEFIKQLGLYFNNNNFLGRHHGPPRVEIKSLSHSSDELSSVRDALMKHTFNTVILDENNFKKPAIPSPRFEGFSIRQKDANTYRVHESINKIHATEPEHFFYSPPRFKSLNHGQWAVELEIERHNNLSQASNVIDKWVLPRRRNVVKAFTENSGKITRAHYLALIPTSESFPIGHQPVNTNSTYDLFLPEDETVFRLLIEKWKPPVEDLRSNLSPKSYEDIAVSDKGQNLRGVIAMFDSLDSASEILTNKCWREVLREWKSPSENNVAFSLNDFRDRSNCKAHKEKIRTGWDLSDIGQAGRYIDANRLDTLDYLIKRNVFSGFISGGVHFAATGIREHSIIRKIRITARFVARNILQALTSIGNIDSTALYGVP